MRNPDGNPQTSSWMKIVVSRFRTAVVRVKLFARGGTNARRRLLVGLLVLVVAGGISLVALARERASKNEAPHASSTAATAATATPESTAANASAPRASKPGATKSSPAAKEKSAEKESATEKQSERENEPSAAPQGQGTLNFPGAESEEFEGTEYLRERAEWFYKQRAYPLGRIPAGVRQKAVEHRKAMEARQQLEQAANLRLAAAVVNAGVAPILPQVVPPIVFPGPANWTPIGPQPLNADAFTGANFGNPSASGRIDWIALDPGDATHQTFYLATAGGGVWKTINGGGTWAPLTDNEPSLSMGAVQVSPLNRNIIYAATGEQNSFGFDNYFGAGVLKSTNGGTSWTQTGTPAGAPFVGPFSGTSFVNSFFGGAHIGTVAINPANDNLVLVSVQFGGTASIDTGFGTPSSGVYCTDNGGTTWAQIASASTTMASFVGFASSTVAYAGIGYTFGDANNGVYVSTNANGGASKLCSAITFAKSAGTGLPTSNIGRIILGLAPSDATGKTAYAAIADSSKSSNTLLAFLKTTDGGATWVAQSPTPAPNGFCDGQCWYDMAVGVDPSNANNVAVGGSAFTNNSSTIWLSTTGGTSWTDITTGATAIRPHVDTHTIVFVPGTKTLLTGDDGGVWSTADYTLNPPTWVDLNSTLQITQHYPGLSISRSDQNIAFSGSQDNGTDAFTGSPAWTHVACGDGGFTAIDAQFDTTMYAACQNIFILKSYFNGAPGTFIPAFLSGFGADRHSFISPLIQGPGAGLLYFGTFRVYQTTNGGDLWTPISPDLALDGASNVNTIGVSSSNPDVVYAGTGDGQVWRTTNATAGSGAIWTNLTKAPLPNRAITTVWVDDQDPNTAWLAFSGFSGFADTVGHLFQTTDGGASWTDVSCTVANCKTPAGTDLPNSPVNEVKFDSNSNTIFVATDVGVFSSTMGSGSWSVFGTGLPNAVVLSLNGNHRGTIGYAATHGRGTWAIALPGTPPAGAFLASMSPASANAGAAGFPMTLDGANFTASSAVNWDGAVNGIVTTFGSANQLTATIPAGLLATGGQHSVTVSDPTGNSKQLIFNIMAPPPTLSFISPTSGPSGTAINNLVATGSGFVQGSTLLVFNGTQIAGGTVAGGGTTLTVNVPAALVNFSGAVPVDVFNPQPGGGDSGNPQAFTITVLTAAITTLSPATVGAGGPGFLLTVNGTNFASNASVTVGGTSRPVTFVSSSQLLVSVSASEISVATSVPIQVFNPGDAPSNIVNLTVTSAANPVPTILSLSPNPVAAGSNFVLTVTNADSSYVGNSVVHVNGVAVATIFVDAMHLKASVPSVDVATPGTVPVTVFNPVPGGGTSIATNLTVSGAVPTISNLSPNSAPAGSAGMKLTVNGSNYDSTAVVKWAGSPRTTTLVTSTQLTANITTADLSTGGSFAVTVTNSSGTSNAVNFTVTGGAGAPSISFTPSSLSFGNHQVGIASAVTNVQITNNDTNGVVLQITAINIGGTNAGDFTLTAPTGGQSPACPIGNNAINLAQGASCFEGISFNPSGAGARSATMNVADDAAASPQSVALSGTGTQPSISFTPPSLNFGNQQVGVASAVTNIQVTNNTANGDPLHITAINVGGANASDFTLTAPTGGQSPACPIGNNPITLAQGASCFEGISFNPAATGARSATMNVGDDAAGSPQSATLSGTGTRPSISFTPTSLNFGNQTVGVASTVQNVQVTNNTANGNPLHITAINVGGTNASDFTLTAPTGGQSPACPIGNNPITLAQGASCFEGISFNPGATGARSASMNVADDAAGSPQSVALSGTGIAPVLSASLTPNPVAFGNQRINTTSAALTATLSNTGTGTLNLAASSAVVISGTNASDFTIATGTTCTNGFAVPAPSGSCVVKITFKPGATGARTATLTVTDNATPTTQSVTLNGTGTAPVATVTPNPLAFGNQRKGTTSGALTVTVKNTGTDTLNLAAASAVVIGGTNAADFANAAGTTCANSTVLAPNATCIVNITFTPSTTGAQAGTLTITDDSGGVAGTVQNVSLTGTGVLPQGAAAPPTLAFGNQPKGVTSAALTATLTNSGSDTLNLAAANAVAISGANAADFAVVAGTTTCKNSTAVPPAPGPGNSCVVNVTFTPSTTAAETATLTITDDSGGVAGSTQTVSLTGTGTTATVALTPSPEQFGNQRVGTTSGALTITLTNSGNAPVTLAAANAVSIAGGNAADFAITGGTCANGLALTAAPGPGNACTVMATLKPSALGPENTTLTVTFQGSTPAAPDNLTGTGVFPQATPTPNPLNFNNQVINTTSGTMTVTVTNGGTDTLHLAAANAAVIGGANAAEFAIASGTTCSNSAAIAPGGNCIVNLTFTPTALNARTATLTITDDANPTTQVDTLNGTGTNPVPTITTLSRNSAIAGSGSFPLTIDGSNFAAGATVNFGANPALTPTTETAFQIMVIVPFSDIATAGNFNVTVTNPAPGGGTSAPVVFAVSNPVPTLTSIAPTSGVLGQSVNLTLTGTGFVAGSIVNFGANADGGGAVSNVGNTLTITIPAAQLSTAGPVNVTVTNPAPGGGTTTAQVFTVNNPAPTLTAISPTSGTLGQSVNLTLTGTGFISGSVVNFGANADAGGVPSNGGTTLTITIPAAQLSTAGPVNVTVTTPAPGGGTTTAQVFTVNNPAPTLTSISPTSGTLGQPVNLTLTGTGFIAGSVVNFGANADAGGVPSNGGTTLTITIPAAQLSTAGLVNVTVKNPAPGGGTSAAQTFTINNPVPTVTPPLSPASANAGAAAFTLTITGTKFAAGATVNFGSNPALTPTTITATTVTVTVPAADIATGGTINVTVTNPAPGGGTSSPAATFTVNNPVPTLATATANGATHIAGGTGFTLTVTGTLFVSTSAINFNGKTEPTTFVSATQLTAAIPASDAATAGTFPVTVTNPTPGGGTAASVNFTLDGVLVSGPASTTVRAGQQATLAISVTPTTNGFANAVSFTVSGLPAHTTATFSPATVTPNGKAAQTTLTITTTARGEVPLAPIDPPAPPLLRLLPVLWLATILGMLCAMKLGRVAPQRRRYAAMLPLVMLLVTGAVLMGCAGPSKPGTPAGTSQLTITATSGTLSVTTPANSVALTVQ